MAHDNHAKFSITRVGDLSPFENTMISLALSLPYSADVRALSREDRALAAVLYMANLVGFATDRVQAFSIARAKLRVIVMFLSVHLIGANTAYCLDPTRQKGLKRVNRGAIRIAPEKKSHQETAGLVCRPRG